MSTDNPSSVSIQAEALPIASVPAWFGEVALIAHTMSRLGLLADISERVHFARKRFGRFEVIDFVVMLMGYAISGEPTLKAYYERLQPFAPAFMALFGRSGLPHRAILSRFLAALDEPFVEALRSVFLHDALARLGPEADVGGLWDRLGTRWSVFDLDATRRAARQRALPQGPDLPPAQRRLSAVCAPGYMGRKRGEVVRTRTTILQAHTHQWLFTSGAAGNGDYRGELLRGFSVIAAYQSALGLLPAQALVRLDGLYGNGAIVVDLIVAGICFVMRGKDYALLDLMQVKQRLALPADEQFTHPESGTCRDLFDCGQVPVTAQGHHCRVIVATHVATTTKAPIGVTRDGLVHELFFTALPASGFTAADVVMLYLHRGSGHRRCLLMKIVSRTLIDGVPTLPMVRRSGRSFPNGCGICAKNSASSGSLPRCASPSFPPLTLTSCHQETPRWQDHPSVHHTGHTQREEEALGGRTFSHNLMGPCVVNKGPHSIHRSDAPNMMGRYACSMPPGLLTVAVVPYAFAVKGMAPPPAKPRRVSAVLHPLPQMTSEELLPSCFSAPHPVLWGDWPRTQPRRAWIQWQRSHLVTVGAASVCPSSSPSSPFSRAERAHWRLTRQQRLARNARPPTAPPVEITISGLSLAFAQSLGLRVV
jgi:hypothetical protein